MKKYYLMKNKSNFTIIYSLMFLLILMGSIFYINIVTFEGPVTSYRAFLVAVFISFLVVPFYLLKDKLFFFYIISMPFLQRIYQVLIYDDYPVGDSFFRMILMVHLSFTITIWLIVKRVSISFREILFVLIWVLINANSVIYANYSNGGWLPFLSIYMPVVLYFYFRIFFAKACADNSSFLTLFRTISFIFLFFLLVSIFMYFVELQLRGSTGLMGVQFIDTYSTIALILLLWPIFVSSLHTANKFYSIVFYLCIISFLALSFSRGAIATLGMVLLITTIINFGFKKFIQLAVFIIVIFIVAFPFLPELFQDIFWTWGLRLNIVSNLGAGDINFDPSLILNNSRQSIKDFALLAISDSNFMGVGVNNTSDVLHEISNGIMRFGSIHNFSLTLLLERGLFPLLIVLMSIVYLFLNFLRNGTCDVFYNRVGVVGLSGFIIFSHTTGAEYVLNSRYLVNLDIAYFLTLMLCISIRKNDIRKNHEE